MVYYPNLNLNSVSVGGSVLSKIKSYLTPKNAFYAIGFLVFFLIAYYVYKMFASSTKKVYKAYHEATFGSGSSENGGSGEAEIILFYVDWCPHCKTAKPVWDKVKSEYQDQVIKGKRVIFTEINCTNESPDVEEMINKYNIQGYPTIKMLKDGQIIEFDAKPTYANLEQFINSVV
jgi:thiol-disulfide isomerase/thioredoxin